ncbi:unnamed protein product [Diamesa tonsa]
MGDADTNNNNDESKSTVSNLPVLFANGYPTSLEKMSRNQLELFIPFLLKCSLNLRYIDEKHEAPKWWPTNLEYKVPFGKPKNLKKDWTQKMRDIVDACYKHHKCPFLLTYSKELSDNSPESLRFVNNNNSTTSLYNRISKKLLLTFRNENMLYDKKEDDTRKCLLPKLWNAPAQNNETNESNMFDIYLCDNCEAELYSKEAYLEHEKICYIVISDDEEESVDDNNVDAYEQTEQQSKFDFMMGFQLQSIDAKTNASQPRLSCHLSDCMSPKKVRRMPARARTIKKKERERENTIPFSSEAGIFLTRKSTVDNDYIEDNLKKIEDYCTAPSIDKYTVHKYMHRSRSRTFPISHDCSKKLTSRAYLFPRKHYHSATREKNFRFLNRPLIEQCSPCKVQVNKLSVEDISLQQDKLKDLREAKEQANIIDSIDLISDSDDNGTVVFDDDFEMASAFDLNHINGQFVSIPFLSEPVNPYLITTSPPSTLFPQLNLPMLREEIIPNSTSIVQQSTVIYTTSHDTRVTRSSQSTRIYQVPDKKTQIKDWLDGVNNGENFNITNQLSTLV